MSFDTNNKPNSCKICDNGNYLTASEKFVGHRCLDPGHWLASGKLLVTDSYSLARLVAESRAESGRCLESEIVGQEHCLVTLPVIPAEWQRLVSLKRVIWLNMFWKNIDPLSNQVVGRFFKSCLTQFGNKLNFFEEKREKYNVVFDGPMRSEI